MKKITSVFVLSVLLAAGTAFAGEGVMHGAIGAGPGMMDGDMKQHGMMMKEKMKRYGMKEMCSPSMVASNDGGVIVMMGKKLMKYDKHLNLVKQVEMKCDKEDVMCPLMKDKGKMMGEGTTAPEETGGQQK